MQAVVIKSSRLHAFLSYLPFPWVLVAKIECSLFPGFAKKKYVFLLAWVGWREISAECICVLGVQLVFLLSFASLF